MTGFLSWLTDCLNIYLKLAIQIIIEADNVPLFVDFVDDILNY
jgi:hypothetical protein